MTAVPGRAAPCGRSRIPAGCLLWSLVEDALVVDDAQDGGGITVVAGDHRVDVATASPTVREVLRRMCLGPAALQNVAGLQSSFVSWTSGGGNCTAWREVKQLLDEMGALVVLSLGRAGTTEIVVSVSAVEGEAPSPGFAMVEVDPAQPYRLHPAAGVRRPADGPVVLTSPAAPYRVLLHGEPAVGIVGELGRRPRTAADLAGPGADPAAVLDVFAFLAGARLLEPADDAS